MTNATAQEIAPPSVEYLEPIEITGKLALPKDGIRAKVLIHADGTAELDDNNLAPQWVSLIEHAISLSRFVPAQKDGLPTASRIDVLFPVVSLEEKVPIEETQVEENIEDTRQESVFKESDSNNARILEQGYNASEPTSVEPVKDNKKADYSFQATAQVKHASVWENGVSTRSISGSEIKRRSATTAIEALEHEPELYAQSGPKGERNFRLRGFDQRGVAVYLDGVPFSMPWDGEIDLGKLPAEMIEHIQLIKGPSSIVSSPSGIGGTILVETRTPTQSPFFEGHLEVGGLEEGRASVYHGNDVRFLSYAVGAAGSIRDNYRLSSQYEPVQTMEGELPLNQDSRLDNSDRKLFHIASKVDIPLSSSDKLGLHGFMVDGEFGIPSSTSDNRPFFRRFTLWRAINLQVKHESSFGNLSIDDAVYISFYDNRLDAYDDNTYTTQNDANANASTYNDRTIGGYVRLQHRSDFLKAGPFHTRLWLGAQHDTHQQRYLFGVDDTDEHDFARTYLCAVPEVEFPLLTDLIGLLSLQLEFDIPNLADREIEYMQASPDDIASEIVYGPLISLHYRITPDFDLRFSGARRNRIPALSERYSRRVGFTEANASLESEKAWFFGVDLGWRISEFVSLEVNGFDAEVEDLIQNQYLPNTNGVKQRQNVGRARLAGFELSINYTPVRTIQLLTAYGFLYARRLSDFDEEDRIAQIPTHQVSFGLILTPWDVLEFSSYLRLIGAQAFDDYTILGLGELGPYTVWDARVQYKATNFLMFFIKGTNLLDMSYQTKYGFPDRGLMVWLGTHVSVD